MRVITIKDVDDRGLLAVDVKDLLRLLGEKAIRSTWRLSNMDATGAEGSFGAGELNRLSDAYELVDGRSLLMLADNVVQVIDGDFEGFLSDATSPWCIIRAIDSTLYELETDDADALLAVRQKYRCMSERID